MVYQKISDIDMEHISQALTKYQATIAMTTEQQKILKSNLRYNEVRIISDSSICFTFVALGTAQ